MTDANYVSYYDEKGEFITTNNTSETDNFRIPHVDNAATFNLSLWHDKLSVFKLIKHEIDNVFEYEIDGVIQTDDLRVM